jgi:peptide/nickel transport system substrate-binding protein
VHADAGGTYQRNFNPFSTSVLSGAQGFIYEPLILSTGMKPDEAKPWLAKTMEFNEDGTIVTFTVREDVTWSDGEAFTAEDVAFTFQLMKDHPAANTAARPIKKATALSETQAEIKFDEPQFAFEASIGNYIVVPKHIWKDLDPEKETNDDPIGTGPFVLGEFSSQLYTLKKNDKYWDADTIQVQEIQYPSNTSETFNTALQAGDLDWAGGYVADIDKIFVNGDPDNRGYWYPGDGLVTLLYNAEADAFDDLALRKAISLALDRKQISESAMQDYAPVAHPTGLPLPAFEGSLSPRVKDKTFEQDLDKANQLLDDAGYTLDDDGTRVSPSGKKLSWDLQVPSGYVDWVDITQLLQEQLMEIGVSVKPQAVAFDAWLEARNNGKFELTMSSVGMGLTPFDMYRAMLSSEFIKSGTVTNNFARYKNAEADRALTDYASTEDEDEQSAALNVLQEIMVEDLPNIPILQSPNWYQYNEENWSGFPTEDDPYCFGAPFQSPDVLLVVKNLTATA